MYGIVKCLPTSRRKSSSRSEPEPVVVVGHQRPGRAVEVEEPLELGPDRGGVGDDHLAGQQVALGRASRRVADHARAAARPGPPAGRRGAGDGAARRSARGGRRGATVRSGRSRCSRPPAPFGQASRRGRAWRCGTCRASAARRAARCGARGTPRSTGVTGGGAWPSRREGRDKPVHLRTLCYRDRPYADQPRPAPAPPPQRRRTAAPVARGQPPRVAIALPLFLFGTLALLAIVGLRVGGRPPTPTTARACPTRSPARTTSRSTSRRSSTTGPARSSWPASAQIKRDGHPLSTRSRPVLIDATTSIEDKTFWKNAGFDPVGIISAALDTRHGQAPRRLDDHPAARPQAAAARQTPWPGSTYERKIREIIQSIRLTQELPPGVAGKQQIMAAYLNQNFYGNQSYGDRGGRRELLRGHRPVQARPRPGRDPGRHPPVADGLRPGPERRRDVQRAGRHGRSLPGRQDRQLVVPPGLGDRPAPQPHPRADEDVAAS